MSKTKKIARAQWTTPNSGMVSLTKDWTLSRKLPPLYWGESRKPLENLEKAAPLYFGDKSGYFTQGAWLTFALRADRHEQLEWKDKGLYVGGDFNSWGEAIGKRTWKLEPAIIRGKDYYLLNIQTRRVVKRRPQQFKFVTGDGRWLEVPADAPNAVYNDDGIRNWLLDPQMTGHHMFFFTTPHPISHHGQARVTWVEDDYRETALMMPGDFLFDFKTDRQMGARVEDNVTTFRLFAPRASSVKLFLFNKLDESDTETFDLERSGGSTWAIRFHKSLAGAYYYFVVDGEKRDPHSHFDPQVKILDPYALAAAGPSGPGIVVGPEQLKTPAPFNPPGWQDLIVAEVHVRDLAEKAPVDTTKAERRGFTGLKKWVESADFYLSELGVNCVELQPIQQNDASSVDEYHWGYMTTNYFAPNSHYGLNPAKASQIGEFRELVEAFHRRNMAVILDVVYNHVGEPNFLQFIDKRYYFDLDNNGNYVNWSGCGNTLRPNTPMAKRLIIDSLTHLMTAFGVDGFRFDLAELIGVEVLREVERELKKVNPSVILIAEPWSFRGHIGHALKSSGYASWNDGYREFMKKYLCGNGNIEGYQYFLGGSLAHLSAWPAQSVNYVESHDDRCWLDDITENRDRNGFYPTPTDRRRTHLMIATLMMSIGIPMIAEGVDMLRSKQGHNNTYQRGDLNALDYERMRQYSSTHEFARCWIRFRRSAEGKLLRLYERPSDGYLRFIRSREPLSSMATVYNATGERGEERLLYVVNPHFEEAHFDLSSLPWRTLVQLGDHERFEEDGLVTARFFIDKGVLRMPALSCGLWAWIAG